MNDSIVVKVNEFTFLGSMVPGSSSDVSIDLVSSTFNRPKEKIWKWRDLSKAIKVCLYDALIFPIATHARETLKEEDNRKLSVFEKDYLWAIVGFSWMNHIKMDNIRSDLGISNHWHYQRRKYWSGLITWYAKIMSAMSTIYTRTTTIRRPRWWP